MTDTDAPVVTADDVAALRGADSVSFHVYQGKAHIRAYLRMEGARILTARQQKIFADDRAFPGERTREILCRWRAYGYSPDGWGKGTGWNGEDEPKLAAYASITSAQFDQEWRTIASLIGAGDTLTLIWMADNNNDSVRAAGLHVDELMLSAENAKRERRFHVDRRVGLDNTARMIRRYGH